MRILNKKLVKDLHIENSQNVKYLIFIAMIAISAKISANVNHYKGVGKCPFHLMTKPEHKNE